MLAIIIFKNLYPKDFADIYADKGIIKKAFEAKNTYRKKISNEIEELNLKLLKLDKEHITNSYQRDEIKRSKERLIYLQDIYNELPSKTLSQIVINYKNFEFEENIAQNKLLVFLLRKGYINEEYSHYVNYFRGNIDDKNFILSIKNRNPLIFCYKLYKIDIIISKLQEQEFMQKEIYNFNLLEYLIDDYIHSKKYSEKFNKFIEQLSDENDISWNFINKFINTTKHKSIFILLLAYQWPNMWNYISQKTNLKYERKIYYLSFIIDSDNTIQNLNINDCIKNFIMQDKNIIKSLEKYTSIERINRTLEILDISLDELEMNTTN